MNLQKLLLATLVGSSIVACGGGGDNGPSPTAEPTAEPTQEPQTAWTCPEGGSLYFCDDFEDGTFDDKWDDLISTYDLADPGAFDILDEGTEIGKSLRFTAGTRGGELKEGELILVKASEFGDVPNDYFVEYKIRPRANGNTGNKYLYGMMRYEGQLQWYFGGLNMQNSSASTQVEAGFIDTGAVQRSLQKKKAIELGTEGGTDGDWHTVRTDVVGSTLTAYLDGEELGSWEDTGNTYTAGPGLIGFFTYNRSFEVDYVKVGDPAVKPVQLSLDYADTSWVSAVRGDTLTTNVTAIQSDGTTADTFTVASADDTVVSVATDANAVTLTPVGAGTTTVTFSAGSDSSVQRTLNVQIEPAWDMPTTDYGDITSVVSPLSTGAYADTVLTIEFDSDDGIALGTTGEVRIFDATDTLVDRIKVAGETENVGFSSATGERPLNTSLITLDGSTLTIKPHSQVLAYDAEYTVTIGLNVVTGAKLNTSDFDGLGESSAWTFTTKSAPDANATGLSVDDDGTSADFRSLQGALDWVMEKAAGDATFVDTAFTISVGEGVYDGLYFLKGKNNLTIEGVNGDNTAKGDNDLYNTAGKTVIQGKNSEGLNGGSSGRALFLVEGVDMLTLDSLTLYNTHVRTGSGDQAETIYFNSTSGRLIATNAQFISEQDTLLLKGYNWFHNSLVAGNVDFIWGYSVATIFEASEIRSLGDSKVGTGESSGGYLLQARTSNVTDPGFVFLDSELTSGAGPVGVTITTGTTHLARSGGSSSYFDNVTFVNTKMGDHVADIGFAYEGINSQPAPNPAVADATSGWKEFNSLDASGATLDMSDRCDNGDGSGKPDSCYELSQAEVDANYCSRAQIFASFDNGAGWDPYPEDVSDDACSLPNAEAWSGAAMQLGGSTSGINGSIDAQTDTSVTLTAEGGKFESKKTSMYLASQDVTGDFTITAKVKAVGTLRESSSYQFPAGLMMCVCDAASATSEPLANASIHDITADANVDLIAGYGHILAADGSWGKTGSTAVTPGDDLYLKLVRTGQDYAASVSTDGGVTYSGLGGSTFTALPDTIKVGVFAAPNGSGAQVFTFEDIQITQ
ncbi:pectinesterase family protein [Teredinibacter franksiae]|uniref:pectinesterase family protein n=1 Tax=Teredinibacter franksiae TaxID=2761453 RepID=UPI001625E646|nr:pectinesterase family protein [Teredinibacter franksiae]